MGADGVAQLVELFRALEKRFAQKDERFDADVFDKPAVNDFGDVDSVELMLAVFKAEAQRLHLPIDAAGGKHLHGKVPVCHSCPSPF